MPSQIRMKYLRMYGMSEKNTSFLVEEKMSVICYLVQMKN